MPNQGKPLVDFWTGTVDTTDKGKIYMNTGETSYTHNHYYAATHDSAESQYIGCNGCIFIPLWLQRNVNYHRNVNFYPTPYLQSLGCVHPCQ